MSSTSNPGESQSIEELQKRYQRLYQQRVRAEANRETAESRVAELKAEAKATYGTDDVAELRQQLETLKAENERKRSEYQAHLDAVEADLATVERNFQDDES